MATSYEIIQKNVVGKLRQHIISCTLDAASANIDTGLSRIIGHTVGCVSMTTAGLTFKKNVGSAATARNGIMNVNSAVSGDVFVLTVYGV
jgi:hypothetical protein